MNNQPNEAELRMPCGICGALVLRHSLTHSFAEYHDCKPVPGAKLDEAKAEITSLRSALAAAEKERDRLREHHSFYQSIQASQQSHHSLCARVASAAIKSRVVYNFGACGGGEPTLGAIVAKIEEAIARCDAIASERDALAAQLAEARGLLEKIANTRPGSHCSDTGQGEYTCETCEEMSDIAAKALAPPSGRGAEDAPTVTIRLALEEARNAGDILGIFKPYIGHQPSCGRHVGAGCSCGLADTLEATRGALVVTPSASAPVEVMKEIRKAISCLERVISHDWRCSDHATALKFDGAGKEALAILEALAAALKGKEE